MEYFKCTKCEEVKSIDMFTKRKESGKGIKSNCKLCDSKRAKEWRSKNKEKIREYKRNWKKNKKNTDPLFRFDNNIRKLIHSSFKNSDCNFRKKSTTQDILGCTIDEFIKYIESKFTKGMTFENHTTNGWHLDHIIPISSAKTEEDIIRLNHYTNFQPMWANENIKKSNKIIEIQLTLI